MIENKIQKNEETIYEEWVPRGKVIKYIMLFVFLLIASIGIIIAAFKPEGLILIGIIFGTVSLFVVLLYWNFRGLRIIITSEYLNVNYGIFNHKNIPLQEITGCEETKANFKRYGGIGVRLGWDGSVAYNTDFGEAVKLILRKGRPFVFSTRNPQKICNLIEGYSNN